MIYNSLIVKIIEGYDCYYLKLKFKLFVIINLLYMQVFKKYILFKSIVKYKIYYIFYFIINIFFFFIIYLDIDILIILTCI